LRKWTSRICVSPANLCNKTLETIAYPEDERGFGARRSDQMGKSNLFVLARMPFGQRRLTNTDASSRRRICSQRGQPRDKAVVASILSSQAFSGVPISFITIAKS
jgi:hypothetical protein